MGNKKTIKPLSEIAEEANFVDFRLIDKFSIQGKRLQNLIVSNDTTFVLILNCRTYEFVTGNGSSSYNSVSMFRLSENDLTTLSN